MVANTNCSGLQDQRAAAAAIEAGVQPALPAASSTRKKTSAASANISKNELYIQLLCTICAELCHRAARTSCCGIQACRGCATKELTRTYHCWSCGDQQSTKQLVNDGSLREKVEEFKKMTHTSDQPKPASAAVTSTKIGRSRSKLTVAACPPQQQQQQLMVRSATVANLGLTAAAAGKKAAVTSDKEKKAVKRSKSKLALTKTVSSLPTKDDKVQLQPSKETATRIPAEDLPAAATAVAAAIVPSRRNRSKSNPRLKTVPRENDDMADLADEVNEDSLPPGECRTPNHLTDTPFDGGGGGGGAKPARSRSQSRLKKSNSFHAASSAKAPNGCMTSAATGAQQNGGGDDDDIMGQEAAKATVVVVNDENLAPAATQTTPRTMSRFAGRSRLKKVMASSESGSPGKLTGSGVSSPNRRGSGACSSPCKTTNLELLTLENTRKNSEFDVESQSRPKMKAETGELYTSDSMPRYSTPGSTPLVQRKPRQSCLSQSSKMDFTTPKTVGRQFGSSRRIGWSQVKIFYFPRAQGFSSVPREGGNTLGMEARHTDCQTWDLAEAELSDLRVKRKLFQPDPAAAAVGEAAASAATLDQPPSGQMSPDSQAASDGEPDALVGSWPGDLNPELRLSVDEEDDEISFKGVAIPAPVPSTTPSCPSPQPGSLSRPITPSAPASESLAAINIFQRVPEKQSSPFKRSLSRSYSGDGLATSPPPSSSGNGRRRPSLVSDPPRKAHKPCPLLSDEENTAFEAASTTSPQKRPNGQLLAASRSSSRLNSVRQLASAGRSTPVLGGCITPVAAAAGGLAARPSRMSKSATKTDLNRKTTSASRPSVLGSVRATRSSVDLKQLDECFIPGSSKPYSRPDAKLVRTISKNCLRSFQEYHTSPEMKQNQLTVSQTTSPPPSLSASSPSPSSVRASTEESGKECGSRGLNPLTNRSRFWLLKNGGVTNLDKGEAEEAKAIRDSRQNCGCNCKGGCVPATCQCALEGIECQVERAGFPCSCTKEACANPSGRRAYDRTEIELHYIQTMMNMEGVLDISGCKDAEHEEEEEVEGCPG